ncbi:Na+/H+ antiporter subunit E [Devosia sp. Leaf64]|jgi:multicomponent Na+:H+ antiporter subunit E|uniref:Na+/H+ antiporter subunit E n=1 Tax=Devosia sp. Leaf64 TaxID=1736229 RepID=UPI000714B42C|nr:Na+/H+ antiporter subunit E [Devosia sp. Leaf64]KQN72216.1 cation:proton antiporter [Devosia sp. Leaf64]
MNSAFLVVILALIWAGISGNFSGLNLLFGGVIGSVAIFVLRSSVRDRGSIRKARQLFGLALLFLVELLMSAIRVAAIVLRPDVKSAIRPAVVAVPLTVTSDAEITLLANMITLTPGTLSIDVAEDRSVLYVHVLSMTSEAAVIADIKTGFEARIAEIFK